MKNFLRNFFKKDAEVTFDTGVPLSQDTLYFDASPTALRVSRWEVMAAFIHNIKNDVFSLEDERDELKKLCEELQEKLQKEQELSTALAAKHGAVWNSMLKMSERLEKQAEALAAAQEEAAAARKKLENFGRVATDIARHDRKEIERLSAQLDRAKKRAKK